MQAREAPSRTLTPGLPPAAAHAHGPHDDARTTLEANEHTLADLIDLDRLQRVFDGLSAAFDINLGIVDTRGHVLVASGWQDICTLFHRAHDSTRRACVRSDTSINRRLREGLGSPGPPMNGIVFVLEQVRARLACQAIFAHDGLQIESSRSLHYEQ